jgi:hypothetical protein
MLSTSDASSPERALDVGRRRGARAGLAASTVAVRHGREVVGRLHTAVHAAPQCFNASTLGTGCSSPPPPPSSPPSPPPPSPPPTPVVEVQAQAVTPPASLASRPTAAVALLATMATLAALLMA